jgi:hypothetical protein
VSFSDAKWELLILDVVHSFYLKLLQESLQGEVPMPRNLELGTLNLPGREPEEVADLMRQWLKLLDMAITPAMLRENLKDDSELDLAEALLRYYARKLSHTDFDRDKTDFVSTFIYKHPRVPGQWDRKGVSMDGVAPLPPYEIALMEILDDAELPDLTPDESRKLEEFEFMREELEHLESFDKLIDSGLMLKARHLKHDFGPGFYHPHALATIAPYNELLGRRFNELFESATKQIRNYADEMEKRGASLSHRIDDEFTLQHLKQLEEQKMLLAEYGRAQEYFRYVARLKRAVDAKTAPARSVPAAFAPVAKAPEPAPSPVMAAPRAPAAPAETVPMSADVGVMKGAAAQEDSRIRSVEDSIRAWVRAADQRYREVVPMKFGNFVLFAHEADAFSADYIHEKSFRGDNARAFMRMLAIIARMAAEIEELKQRQNSNHLWRPHAQNLLLLLEAAKAATEEAKRVMRVAADRGLVEKVNAFNQTFEKLSAKVEQVQYTLAMVGVKPEPALV